MLALADHNKVGSFSKQHQKTKIADLTEHVQQFEKCKLKKNSSMPPDRSPPYNFLVPPAQQHRTLVPLSQSSASISLFGNLRIESSVIVLNRKVPFLCVMKQ